MGVTNDINTSAQFPNLDQYTAKERSVFVSEHEFETALNLMVTELDNLLDNSSGNVSEIENQKNRVSEALNKLTSDIESNLHDLISRYINLIQDETNKVSAAEERIYSKIQQVIQGINVNIQNRTITYDTVMSYKLRILDAVYRLFGTVSPYSDSRKYDDRYFIKKGQVAVLRDVDEGIGFRSCSISLDPTIQQGEVIKLCSWDPIENGTAIPTFLAELIISGDLFAFKGIVSSTNKNKNGDRTVVFDADYFTNQDLPFSIKTFYDKTNNKIVLALVYDNTNDNFTSIVKLDLSVNLLIGENLVFAPNSTKMANAGLITFGVTANVTDLDVLSQSGNSLISQYGDNEEYLGSVNKTLYRVQTGTTVNVVLKVPEGKESEYSLPNIYNEEFANYIKVKVNGVYRNISNTAETDTHFYLSSGLLSIENVDGEVVIIANAAAIRPSASNED